MLHTQVQQPQIPSRTPPQAPPSARANALPGQDMQPAHSPLDTTATIVSSRKPGVEHSKAAGQASKQWSKSLLAQLSRVTPLDGAQAAAPLRVHAGLPKPARTQAYIADEHGALSVSAYGTSDKGRQWPETDAGDQQSRPGASQILARDRNVWLDTSSGDTSLACAPVNACSQIAFSDPSPPAAGLNASEHISPGHSSRSRDIQVGHNLNRGFTSVGRQAQLQSLLQRAAGVLCRPHTQGQAIADVNVLQTRIPDQASAQCIRSGALQEHSQNPVGDLINQAPGVHPHEEATFDEGPPLAFDNLQQCQPTLKMSHRAAQHATASDWTQFVAEEARISRVQSPASSQSQWSSQRLIASARMGPSPPMAQQERWTTNKETAPTLCAKVQVCGFYAAYSMGMHVCA
jgi:hypothetical protein